MSDTTETINIIGKRPPLRDPNELTIIVDGMVYGGWEDVRVTRGVERMPSDFDIRLTELYPGQASRVVMQPGQVCVVMLGNDVILNGYVDDYAPSYNATSHEVQITGRGKCEDLVDCAAGFPGPGQIGSGQFGNGTVFSNAQVICAPFGIDVNNLVTVPSRTIPLFNITYGETCYEIIERMARYSAQLAYEGTDGSLILSQVGTTQAASGFQEGVNVQAGSARYSIRERFSDYFAFTIGTSTLSDVLSPNSLLAGSVTDPTVTRFRPMALITSEMQQNITPAGQADGPPQYVAALRANWEKARRYGRSQAVTLTCDSWRDSAGTLWAPNTLAPINLPHLKLTGKTWVISEVSFMRGESGTTAELTLMPPEAFMPEPVALQMFDWQAELALSSGGAAKP